MINISDWTLGENEPNQSQYAGLWPEIRSTKLETCPERSRMDPKRVERVLFEKTKPILKWAKWR